MKQSKLESIIERTVDIATGFIISVIVYKYVILTQDWLWSSPILVTTLFTTLFTVISFVRGYLWRRFFNAELHKVAHEFVTRWKNNT